MKEFQTLKALGRTFLILVFALTVASSPGFAQEGTGGDNVIFKQVWVDYDVYENNQKGMRVHMEFDINNFVNIDSYMVVRVLRGDDPIMGNLPEYRSQGGHLAVYRSFKPAYDYTYYSDLAVFLPYDAIPLNTGNYDLQLDIDLIYNDGTLISHMALHPFTFTR